MFFLNAVQARPGGGGGGRGGGLDELNILYNVSLARVYLDYLVNKICAMHDK